MVKYIASLTFLVSIAFFAGCPQTHTDEYGDVPADVLEAVRVSGHKNFPSNKALAENFVKRQLDAYRELSKFIPDLPTAEFSKILKYAVELAGDDYVMQLSAAEELSAAAEDLRGRVKKYNSADAKFIAEFFDDDNVVDYKNNLSLARSWCDIFDDINYAGRRMPADAVEHFKNEYKRAFRRTPDSVSNRFYTTRRSYENVANFSKSGVSLADMAAVKEDIARKYPYDFDAQYRALRSFDFSDQIANARLLRNSTPEQIEKIKREKSLRAMAEDIFRECVFTRHGLRDQIDVAVLVSIKGKPVIVCSKNFIPERMPVQFGNSSGMITCSTAYVSEEYPLIIMIPDSVPELFKPISVITPDQSRNIAERELYLIAPNSGGFMGKPVRVFSEDIQFLNFSDADTPKTERTADIKALDRRAEKIIIDIKDKYEIGENAVVFDPKSRLLVSLALRYFDFGLIDMAGRTGNVIGFEKMPIPDFTTFVRRFGGGVHRTLYSPESSVRFVRMTALSKWRRLDPREFYAQKNAIRKYTDVNNDYLGFLFSDNGMDGIHYAVRSPRISRIVARYKSDFERNLSDAHFRNRYEAFIVDILNSMRIDMNKAGNSSYTPDNVYSIYRGELAYQMALRKSMYEYMKEFIKDGNITAFIREGLPMMRNLRDGGVRRGVNINAE